jgi:tol-pal system protein YbgF
MLQRSLLLLLLAIVAVGPVRAGLFDDDEARKRIISNEKEMREKNAAIDERVSKLEASIKNLGILELVNQIESLKNELSQLRGQIEVVNNQIATVDKKQRDFYLDLDSRLRRLEQPATGATPGATSTAPASPASTAPVDPKEAARQAAAEKKAYDAAYALFQKKSYSRAIAGFQSFIDNYPGSPSASSALYWIGLSQYNLGDFKTSLTSQQNLIKSYPDSPKVPDAMLAIAGIHAEHGDAAASRSVLEDIIARYPASDAAGKAKQRLAVAKR